MDTQEYIYEFLDKFIELFFQTCLRHKMAIDGGASCRGGIIDKIRLGLYKYFRFS